MIFLLGAVFFSSGFAALLYQITWQRALYTVFGINVEAVTVVVTGFLLGLGMGSLLGGYLSRRTRLHLVTLFAWVELLLGLNGLVSLQAFQWAGRLSLEMSGVITAVLTVTLVFIPTLLMGATLPILTQHVVNQAPNVGRSVGLLYSVNTVGSATACVVSAVWLMRTMGMQKSVFVAAAINIAVAVTAFTISRLNPTRTDPPRSAIPDPHVTNQGIGDRLPFGLMLATAVGTGFIALSYELLWFRSFMVGTNIAPAFALILGAYLGGIGLGAYAVHRYCHQPAPTAQFRLLCVLILGASAVGFLVLPLAARAAAVSFSAFVFGMLGLVFVQTVFAGAVFPLICHLGVKASASSGSGVSKVYLGNIVGSAAGAAVTGFVLMDLLPTRLLNLALVVGGAVLMVAVAVAIRRYLSRTFLYGALAAASLLVAMSAAMTAPLFDSFFERITYKARVDASPRFVDVVENRSGVVAVAEDGTVYGGGIYDGRASIELLEDKNHLIRPISLGLFHPAPRKVLMIGLATGAWAQVVAHHPDVEHLTVVEINPGYLSLIDKYPDVKSLLTNPKVKIVIDDGRRWLNRNATARFDAILQNTTWYFRPNATNLLSKEYLGLTAQHLLPGGVALVNMTFSERALLTGCAVFTDGFRQLGAFVGSNDVLRLHHDRFRRQLEMYRIDGVPLFNLSRTDHRQRIDDIVSSLTPRTSILLARS